MHDQIYGKGQPQGQKRRVVMIWMQNMCHRLVCLTTCSQGGLTIWGVCGTFKRELLREGLEVYSPIPPSVLWFLNFMLLPPRDPLR